MPLWNMFQIIFTIEAEIFMWNNFSILTVFIYQMSNAGCRTLKLPGNLSNLDLSLSEPGSLSKESCGLRWVAGRQLLPVYHMVSAVPGACDQWRHYKVQVADSAVSACVSAISSTNAAGRSMFLSWDQWDSFRWALQQRRSIFSCCVVVGACGCSLSCSYSCSSPPLFSPTNHWSCTSGRFHVLLMYWSWFMDPSRGRSGSILCTGSRPCYLIKYNKK